MSMHIFSESGPLWGGGEGGIERQFCHRAACGRRMSQMQQLPNNSRECRAHHNLRKLIFLLADPAGPNESLQNLERDRLKTRKRIFLGTGSTTFEN